MKTIFDHFLEDVLGADAFHMSLAEILDKFYDHIGIPALKERLRLREAELQKCCTHPVLTCGTDTGFATECSRCGSKDVMQMAGSAAKP